MVETFKNCVVIAIIKTRCFATIENESDTKFRRKNIEKNRLSLCDILLIYFIIKVLKETKKICIIYCIVLL